MNCGYAVYAGNKYPEQQPNARSSVDAFVAFEDMMVKDVIPLVDSTYRTLTDKENRAMAGLSWGGKQTLETTLHHRDLFSYIGSFSGALPIDKNTDIDALYEDAFKDPVTFNKDFKFIWLGIGEEEGPNAGLGTTILGPLESKVRKPVWKLQNRLSIRHRIRGILLR